MIEYRPCGACVELVPAAYGCTHWHPSQGKPGAGKSAESRERKRERDRINVRAARARAKADVAAFREKGQR